LNRYYPGFYYDNKPNYVCDGGFRNIEANIYCRSIGYSDGGIVGLQSKEDMKLNVAKNSVFVQSVFCPPDSISINKSCRVMSLPADYNCSDFYQVIQCKGQRKISPEYIAPLEPPRRLPLPRYIKATCATTALEINGDPGSTFIVKCPENCNQDDSKV